MSSPAVSSLLCRTWLANCDGTSTPTQQMRNRSSGNTRIPRAASALTISLRQATSIADHWHFYITLDGQEYSTTKEMLRDTTMQGSYGIVTYHEEDALYNKS